MVLRTSLLRNLTSTVTVFHVYMDIAIFQVRQCHTECPTGLRLGGGRGGGGAGGNRGIEAESGSRFKRMKLTKDLSSVQNKTVSDIQVLKEYNRCNCKSE